MFNPDYLPYQLETCGDRAKYLRLIATRDQKHCVYGVDVAPFG